jgi:ankyrin repeat protein
MSLILESSFLVSDTSAMNVGGAGKVTRGDFDKIGNNKIGITYVIPTTTRTFDDVHFTVEGSNIVIRQDEINHTIPIANIISITKPTPDPVDVIKVRTDAKQSIDTPLLDALSEMEDILYDEIEDDILCADSVRRALASVNDAVEKVADVNEVNRDGGTPLHMVTNFYPEVFDVVGVDIFKLLVRKGADVGRVNNAGYTAFCNLIPHDFVNDTKIRALLNLRQNGIDVTKPDANGRTPLHIVAANSDPYGGDGCDLSELLFKYMPEEDVLNKDNNGNTPLHLAITRQNYRLIKFLAPLPKNFYHALWEKNKKGETPEDIMRESTDIKLGKLSVQIENDRMNTFR